MKFLNHITRELSIVTLLFCIFGFIFYAYNLPAEGFIIGICVCTFVLLIYFVIRFLYFQKSQSLQEENEVLKESIQTLKNDQLQFQSEIEAYFLTWVHQMKTPITASKLILENGQNIDQLRQELLQIDNYANLALSYLKLLNQRTEMVIMPVTIDDLIKPLLKKYAIQFIHFNTKLQYSNDHHTVLTDAKWASIMIEQLLNNALKYARGTQVTIVFNEEDNTLSIIDEGIGIHASDLPKIFDRGFSGYNGRLNEKSSGIGLYVASTIAKRLNTSISVESVVNQGSKFHIHF